MLFLVHFLIFLSKEDFAFKIKESFKNRENENGGGDEGANPVPIKSTGSSACRTTSPLNLPPFRCVPGILYLVLVLVREVPQDTKRDESALHLGFSAK